MTTTGNTDSTAPLFYDDPYRIESTGLVEEGGVDDRGRPFVVLSETVCHPHGGGQKGDRGEISLTDEDLAKQLGVVGGINIVDTRKDGRLIRHILERPLVEPAGFFLLEGCEANVKLDWSFRWTQMRLHSTAHLLHCFVEEVLQEEISFPETSDLVGPHGLNRYEQPSLIEQDQFTEILQRLNDFIRVPHTIATGYDPSPSSPEGARLWKCEEWVIPCGGTHPHETTEIGVVEGRLSTKRGRTSITFETV